jgi:hypothetical protein
MTKQLGSALLASLVIAAGVAPAGAADDAKVKDATRQVERGAAKIGQGKIGAGLEETAKGIGNTVVEGSKYTGEKLKESSRAAEPEAKSAWAHARDGAITFGRSVRDFFATLFSGD